MASTLTPEAQSFLQRVLDIPQGPGALLDPVLKPSLDNEAELRRLFVADRTHVRLKDPYVALVDVFAAPDAIRTTRARVVNNDSDFDAQYVMPLSETKRRKEGEPSMVSDLDEFKKNWSIFSEGSLSQLVDWNNVIVAGGSVLACLAPLPKTAKVSKRSMRKYYHSKAYPSSDIDLFLWGLTPEQAEVKIIEICDAVRDSVPWDITCLRTKHTVSIHSQYPYRSVQIVLRLYSSPAEILAGFDIDAPCCAYNGTRLYASPRAIVAMMRQCNTADVTRRSPSYEVRLTKYAARGFEVYVPNLSRTDIDPTIYERSIVRVTGLARLLVLERIMTEDVRLKFLQSRRTLRGRPNPLEPSYRRSKRSKRRNKDDLKADGPTLDLLQLNDYDVLSLHIPYGPCWDAATIEKLVYQTDLGMNSTFNPKNKGRRLHRHPAFYGTIQECLEDCCGQCPAPIDEDERKLQAKEDNDYIRGRISFIQDDPGRQSLSGSFHPIDDGEWSAQVYIGPTEKFFRAIAADDRVGVVRMVSEGQDVNRRDHVGRAPLHFAIICRSVEIACDLIAAGARMTARLVDGRTALHLAAQQDLFLVVRALLDRSAVNAERARNVDDCGDQGMDVDVEPERLSSEDDWTSEEDETAGSAKGNCPSQRNARTSHPLRSPSLESVDIDHLPEDEALLPDVFDINHADWDMSFTALGYAIVFGTLPVLETFLNSGVDVKLVSQARGNIVPVLPLTLTILPDDEERTSQIAERLILAGASCSAADQQMCTIFHRAVAGNRSRLVSSFLRCDPNAQAALNYLTVTSNGAISPLITAITIGSYSSIASMVAHGIKFVHSEQEIHQAFAEASPHLQNSHKKPWFHPVETAFCEHDDVARIFVDLGADINVTISDKRPGWSPNHDRRTLVDWVQYTVSELEKRILQLDNKAARSDGVVPEPAPTWKGCLAACLGKPETPAKNHSQGLDSTAEGGLLARLVDIKEYFVEMGKYLVDHGAKSYDTFPFGLNSSWGASWSSFGGPAEAVRRVRDGFVLDTDDEVEDQPALKKLKVDISQAPTASELGNPPWNPYSSSSSNPYATGNPVAVWGGTTPGREGVAPENEGWASPSRSIQQRFGIDRDDELEDQPALKKVEVDISLAPARQADIRFSPIPTLPPINSVKVKYFRMTGEYRAEAIAPGFLTLLYDELYEACFTGANDRIQELCCPAGIPSNSSTLLQISVSIGKEHSYLPSPTGLTPLFAAIVGRQWNTASLILAIATAQYKPPTVRTRFDASNLVFQYDSDTESDDSDAIDEAPVINFVDIANRTSIVECDVHPKRILDAEESPLLMSVQDDDFEAFINILNLYKHCTKQVDLPPRLLHHLITNDRPDMLDEYIRRTGHGIFIRGTPDEIKVDVPVINDGNKVYLGLSVHGNKWINPVHSDDLPIWQERNPLVFQAASHGANAILDYLLGDRPLAAYRFYSSSNKTPRAQRIKRATDFAAALPGLLGWSVTPLGESPLTAALVSKKLDTVKYLFKKTPRLMASSLHERIKFLSLNPLMLAVQLGCDITVIDLLLAKSISPAETDQVRGWNIFHYMCHSNFHQLLEHLLRKLPRDVVELLLKQQSKGRLNTPLHLCVKHGFNTAVRLVVGFSKASVLVRDVDGCIPLHCAARRGFPEITQILIDANPSGLNMENGVGETPLEIAGLRDLIVRNQKVGSHGFGPGFGGGSASLHDVSENPARLDLAKLGLELPKFRTTLEELVEQGRLQRSTKATTAMFGFAEHLEAKLANARVSIDVPTHASSPSHQESEDTGKVLVKIRAAVEKVGWRRELVHLIDVQASAQHSLLNSQPRHYDCWSCSGDEGDPESSAKVEQQTVYNVFIHNHVLTNQDNL
ncbi:hypothetical protein B0H19DRAFT_1377542 [Mycena capillaripes]|nr:hypothetical protein B0H19DRAFT_1377542 [Mycena capillaripes]